MKNYTIIILLLLGHMTSAQTCFTNGLTLSKQSQIDAIADELASCKVIDGKLALVGDVMDVSAFATIEEVRGSLILLKVPLLTSMAGLENIRKVESLNINTHNVKTLPHFSELEVTGSVGISGNKLIKNLGNLPEVLRMEGGTLSISNNDSLKSIIGFNHIEELQSLLIDSNSSLDTILGFQALKKLTGGFRIHSNFGLDIVNLCPNLASVWSFDVGQNNGGSFDLVGFSNLERIDQGLDISANHGLINIPAFPKLTFVGKGFIINDNVRLTKIKGFNNLDSVGLGIQIIRNNKITEFTCLDKLTYIKPTKGISITGSNPTNNCSFDGLHNIKKSLD